MRRHLNRTILLLGLTSALVLLGCSENPLGFVSPTSEMLPRPVESTIPVEREAERVVVRLIDYEQIHDLSTNPYADAFATAKVLPLETFGGMTEKEPCILKFRVLKDRNRLAAADFQPSDLIGVTMHPEDEMSDNLRSIQTFESVFDPELKTYFAGRPTFLSRPHPHRAEKETLAKQSVRPVPVFDSDPTARLLRLDQDPEKQARIAAAMAGIESHLDREGGGSWEAWQQKLQGFRADLYATANHESEINFQVRKAMELQSYDTPVAGGIPAFDALKQLADQVEAAGMDFVLLSIPSRIETYPEWFSETDGIAEMHVGPTRLHYLQELLEEGIEVIDAGDLLRDAKLNQGRERLFWQGQEFHLSPQGYEVVGAKVAQLIENRGVLADTDRFSPDALAIDQEMVAVHYDPDDLMPARRVLFQKNRTPFRPNQDSPVFFLGDSTLYWWQTNMFGSCGLISQLAYEMNHVVDWKARPNLMPHHAELIDPSRVKGKKLWIQVQTAWVLWSDGVPHKNVKLPADLVTALGQVGP